MKKLLTSRKNFHSSWSNMKDCLNFKAKSHEDFKSLYSEWKGQKKRSSPISEICEFVRSFVASKGDDDKVLTQYLFQSNSSIPLSKLDLK